VFMGGSGKSPTLSSQCLLCVDGDVEHVELIPGDGSPSNLFLLRCYIARRGPVDTHADLSSHFASAQYSRCRPMPIGRNSFMSSFLRSPQAQTPFCVAPSVKEVESEDGAALLDIQQGLCFSLTPVAARIWQLLKLNHPAEKIASLISVEFQAPHDQVDKDVAEFLGSLRQHKLLTDSDPHGRPRGGFLRSLRSPVPRLRTKS
jgi:hypothetical protein